MSLTKFVGKKQCRTKLFELQWLDFAVSREAYLRASATSMMKLFAEKLHHRYSTML